MTNAVKQGLLIILVMLLSATAGVWFYSYHQTDFETLQGETYKWRDLEGNWVIINYFAETQLPITKPPYLPATYIVGPKGQVQAEILGEVTADILKGKIAALQAQAL